MTDIIAVERNKGKARFIWTFIIGFAVITVVFVTVFYTGTAPYDKKRLLQAMGAMLIATGLFQIVLVTYNWNWYKRDFRVKFMIKRLQELGAKLFYALVGVVSIVVGIMFATGVMG